MLHLIFFNGKRRRRLARMPEKAGKWPYTTDTQIYIKTFFCFFLCSKDYVPYFCCMKETVNGIDEVIKAVLIRNVELSNHVSCLEMEIASLKDENAKLREQLSCLEVPEKDSHNSSIPPGKESIKAQSVRRTRSLRMPGGRKSGGQPGHKGSTLLINPTPDETKIHTPLYCLCCGNSLSEITGKEIEIRQSIDIPLPVCEIIRNCQ